jgi:hypothetical protein
MMPVVYMGFFATEAFVADFFYNPGALGFIW